MADDGIGVKIGLQGDKEYKKALQDIGRQMAVLNSSMKASQSAFGDQTGSMEALTDKLDKLNEIYDVQQEKVQLISDQLQGAIKEYGENSKQADQLRIALNKATVQMNGTKNEIDKTQQGLDALKEAQDDAGDATDETRGS